MSSPLITSLHKALTTAQGAIAQAQTIATQLDQAVGSVITTPAQLDAALAKLVGGETLRLDPTLVYLTPLVISKPVTFMNQGIQIGRASLGTPMPSFKAGLTLQSHDIGLYGIDVRHSDRNQNIIWINGGAQITLDGCRVMGDPKIGAKRGIAANAAGVGMRRCYIEDCFGPTPGDDTQAFCAWDAPGPFLIDDCYLSAGSETVLFGGADPTSEKNIPSDIVITNSILTKRPEWQAQLIGVKNTLEFKNAKRFRVEGNIISQSWGGHGQDGYLLMLTPRNQDNTAPYSVVREGVIQNNTFRAGSAAVAILGHDAPHESQPLDSVMIYNNTFEGIDPHLYTGSDKLFFVADGPKNVTITRNTIIGKNIGSQVYLGGAPKAQQLVITKNTWPKSEYGVFGAESRVGGTTDQDNDAWKRFVESGQLQDNVEVA